MSAYVCVRKLGEFRLAVDRAGTQTDVAAAAHLSVQRLNQLYVGTHDVLEVRKARRLEDVLHVGHGTLFAAVDAPLLVPYMADEHGSPPDEDTYLDGRDTDAEPVPAA